MAVEDTNTVVQLVEQTGTIITSSPDILSIQGSINNPIVHENTSTVVSIIEDTNTVLGQGTQGPQGPAGQDLQNISLIAGTALGGNRVVTYNSSGYAVYASSTTENIIGITIAAYPNGALADIQISGFMTEPSWSWTLDLPIYVTDNGQLTQNTPNTGSSYIIGFPVTTTKILIDKQTPIILA